MLIFIIVELDETGEIKSFPMAGGRGASINSVSAFTSLDSAKRALKYRNKYYPSGRKFGIAVADNLEILEGAE